MKPTAAPCPLPGLLAAALLLLTACRDAKVASYRIPKETDSRPTAAAPVAPAPSPGGMRFAAARGADLTWTAPAAWKPKPGSTMRKGSYSVGDDAAPADLAITAFPGDVGGDLANVNRWRGQLSLPPIADADLPRNLTPLSVGGLDIKLAELAGGPADAPQRMLGAIVPYDGATWFFKLMGPDAVVLREKPNFLAFLQTIKAPVDEAASPVASVPPSPAAPAGMTGAPVSAADGPALKWSAPAHWQEKPATAMRKATYAVSGPHGSGEVAVTAFPGGVGGELANLNRWRGQLSLPPLGETEAANAVTRLRVHGLVVTVVDFTAPGADPQRLLGAMVPYDGATWFFKLTGPAPVVADEKPAFLAFLETLSTP